MRDPSLQDALRLPQPACHPGRPGAHLGLPLLHGLGEHGVVCSITFGEGGEDAGWGEVRGAEGCRGKGPE